jgi:hypothetical protein
MKARKAGIKSIFIFYEYDRLKQATEYFAKILNKPEFLIWIEEKKKLREYMIVT